MIVYSVFKVQNNQGQPRLHLNCTVSETDFLGYGMSKTGHRMSLAGLVSECGQIFCSLHQYVLGVILADGFAKDQVI